MLRYGLAGRRSRSAARRADGGEVVAGDRLGLRAAVLVARERVDDVRRVAREVDVEHLPVAVGGLADDELVPGAVRVAVAPDRWFSHGCSLRFQSGCAGAGEVGGFLEPRGDREQRPGLLGEQAGQRPVERDERGRGVQQRAGGVLERGGAVREQPLDGALARERRPRRPGPLGRELLVESDDARRVASGSLIGPRSAVASRCKSPSISR